MLRETDGTQHFSSVQYANWSLSKGFEERNNKWAFIGGKHGKGKQDRESALQTFMQWSPHFIGDSMPVASMKEIYNNSKFVIVGRGWNNLDCFRSYEALISGALPVIVGNDAEIKFAFEFNGKPAPFVHDTSWPAALKLCQQMNSDEFQRRRLELFSWYADALSDIHIKIQGALMSSNRELSLSIPHSAHTYIRRLRQQLQLPSVSSDLIHMLANIQPLVQLKQLLLRFYFGN